MTLSGTQLLVTADGDPRDAARALLEQLPHPGAQTSVVRMTHRDAAERRVDVRLASSQRAQQLRRIRRQPIAEQPRLHPATGHHAAAEVGGQCRERRIEAGVERGAGGERVRRGDAGRLPAEQGRESAVQAGEVVVGGAKPVRVDLFESREELPRVRRRSLAVQPRAVGGRGGRRGVRRRGAAACGAEQGNRRPVRGTIGACDGRRRRGGLARERSGASRRESRRQEPVRGESEQRRGHRIDRDQVRRARADGRRARSLRGALTGSESGDEPPPGQAAIGIGRAERGTERHAVAVRDPLAAASGVRVGRDVRCRGDRGRVGRRRVPPLVRRRRRQADARQQHHGTAGRTA